MEFPSQLVSSTLYDYLPVRLLATPPAQRDSDSMLNLPRWLATPAVILLAFVLALGFLLVILSCALWANWLPLLVALTFVLAPVPNSICSRCARADDLSPEYNSAYVDFGRFLTGMLVMTGLSLPLLLAHSALIHPSACWMSIAGGGLVYGTILVYSGWFGSGGDDEF